MVWNNIIMLEDFDKLCTQIFYYKNKFRFPFDSIIHDKNFQDILNSQNYPILENKMKNLLVLINQDLTKLNQDTKELWELI